MSKKNIRMIPAQMARVEFLSRGKSIKTIAKEYDIHVLDVEKALREELQMMLDYCRTH